MSDKYVYVVVASESVYSCGNTALAKRSQVQRAAGTTTVQTFEFVSSDGS